jgi:hypothetical protein
MWTSVRTLQWGRAQKIWFAIVPLYKKRCGLPGLHPPVLELYLIRLGVVRAAATRMQQLQSRLSERECRVKDYFCAAHHGEGAAFGETLQLVRPCRSDRVHHGTYCIYALSLQRLPLCPVSHVQAGPRSQRSKVCKDLGIIGTHHPSPSTLSRERRQPHSTVLKLMGHRTLAWCSAVCADGVRRARW